jgi:hypothetical protein
MMVVRYSRQVFILGLHIVQIDIGLKEIPHLQHRSMIERIPIPVIRFPKGLIYLAEKGRIIRQILFQECEPLLTNNIQPFLLVTRLGNLRQANHLQNKGEFIYTLSDMPLNGKSITTGLSHRRRFFFLGTHSYNDCVIVIVYTNNGFLSPALKLKYQDTLPRHQHTNIELASIKLTVPVNNAIIIKILLRFLNEKTLSDIIRSTGTYEFAHNESPRI